MVEKKLYRGTSIKECKNYKRKKIIPKGTNFTNELEDAKIYAKIYGKEKCIVEVKLQKKDLKNMPVNIAHKESGFKTRHYQNKKSIKKFKIK